MLGAGDTGGLAGPCPVMKGCPASTTEEASPYVCVFLWKLLTGTLGHPGSDHVVLVLSGTITLDGPYPSVFGVECAARWSRVDWDVV